MADHSPKPVSASNSQELKNTQQAEQHGCLPLILPIFVFGNYPGLVIAQAIATKKTKEKSLATSMKDFFFG